MTITSDQHLDMIHKAIQAELKTRVNAAIEEEIKATAERINQRIRNSADVIALKVLSYYNMRRDGEDVLIRVSKGESK